MTCIIRGFTLTRPWPFAFVAEYEDEPKRIENRVWPPHRFIVGHYLALHAGQGWSEDGREWIAHITGLHVPNKQESPHSEIFAVCRVTGYVESISDKRLPVNQRKWFFGPYGWLLSDFVKLIEPVACKGAQGLWGFEKQPEALAALRRSYRLSVLV